MTRVIVTFEAEVSVVVDVETGEVVKVVAEETLTTSDAPVTWEEGGHTEPVPSDIQERARAIAEGDQDWPAWDRGW